MEICESNKNVFFGHYHHHFFQIIEGKVEHYNIGAFYDDIEDHKQAFKNVLNIKEN